MSSKHYVAKEKLTISITSSRWQIATTASSNSIYRRTTESVGGLFWNREIPGHSDTRGSCRRTQHRGGQNSGKLVDWFVLKIWNSSSIILYGKKTKKKIDWLSLNMTLLSSKSLEFEKLNTRCALQADLCTYFLTCRISLESLFYHRVVYLASLERGAVLISNCQW